MASEGSWEETLLLLRKTISRQDRFKSSHPWIGNEAEIEDVFMDIQRERYDVLHNIFDQSMTWHFLTVHEVVCTMHVGKYQFRQCG